MRESAEAKGRVLIIAGSDSGGGAGIQADIKTVTMLGGYAATAITAITAQNTLGVQGIWPVAEEAIARQIRSVLSDIGADAIKTGMLGTAAVIDCVGEELDNRAKDIPLVVDPVMVATSGDRLVDDSAIGAILSVLVPSAALVTPNAPEAEILTGKAVDGLNGQRRAAEDLLERGAKGVLIKGGHIPGRELNDVLQTEHGEWIFESTRIDSTSTHGTGCTLASGAATGLATGQSVADAVEAARDYVRGAIAHAPGLGKGHGPLGHGWVLNDQDN